MRAISAAVIITAAFLLTALAAAIFFVAFAALVSAQFCWEGGCAFLAPILLWCWHCHHLHGPCCHAITYLPFLFGPFQYPAPPPFLCWLIAGFWLGGSSIVLPQLCFRCVVRWHCGDGGGSGGFGCCRFLGNVISPSWPIYFWLIVGLLAPVVVLGWWWIA